MEVWKKVESVNNYEVSNTGKIRSLDIRVEGSDGITRFHKGRELTQHTGKNGYKYVNFRIDGKTQHRYVHRLVAEAFLENPDMLPEINHKDETRDNNKLENLEWCTRKYNCNYGNRNDKIKKSRFKGSLCARAVILTSPHAFCIFKSVCEAARFSGYSSTTITEHCQSGELLGGARYCYFDTCNFDFYDGKDTVNNGE